MSILLKRLNIPHVVMNESPQLSALLAAHFGSKPSLSVICEAKEDIFESVAEHMEDCKILVVNDVSMSLQLHGSKRRGYKRHAILCIRGYDDYATIAVQYRLHHACLFFICRSGRLVFPTRVLLWFYLGVFVLGCCGSFLASAAAAYHHSVAWVR